MPIKLTNEQMEILEEVRGKMLLGVEVYSSDPPSLKSTYLYVLRGWATKKIPAKRGWFGRVIPEHYVLDEIYVQDSSNFKTDRYFVYSKFLELVIPRFKRDREFFKSVHTDLKEYGYQITEYGKESEQIAGHQETGALQSKDEGEQRVETEGLQG